MNRRPRLTRTFVLRFSTVMYTPRGMKISILPATLAEANFFTFAELPDKYSRMVEKGTRLMDRTTVLWALNSSVMDTLDKNKILSNTSRYPMKTPYNNAVLIRQVCLPARKKRPVQDIDFHVQDCRLIEPNF